MDLTFYIECDDFDDIKTLALERLDAWMQDNPRKIKLLVAPDDLDHGDLEQIDFIEQLGLQLTITRKSQLKVPLKFLYQMATELKCEFAFGYLPSGASQSETICYFGYEEGKPDLIELGTYANLK